MNASTPLLFAFILLCGLLFWLPFVPALREWRRPTDATPLRVLPNYSNDIDYFARRLAADAAAAMGRGPATGYESFEPVAMPVQAMDWAGATGRLLARETISTPTAVRTAQPLYVDGSVRVGARSAFTSVFATGDIQLGEASEVTDWAHADGVLELGDGSGLQRRASSGVRIHLPVGGRFERLHAPEVCFGERQGTAAGLGASEGSGPLAKGVLSDLPGARRQTERLVLVQGDCLLPDGVRYEGSLIVTGFLSLGRGTVLAGDVKARRGLALGEGAAVLGAVVCESHVRLEPRSFVQGPLVSEADILLGAGARIGTAGSHTTVSARDIVVDSGVVVQGSIWAHELGMVRAL